MVRLHRRTRRFLLILGAVVLLVVGVSQIPTDFQIVHPGITVDLSEIISVEGGNRRADGSFLLTSVSTRQANLLSLLYVRLFHPDDYELQSTAHQLPEGMEMEEYIKIMRQMMEESQMVAQAVAFEKAGYETEITGDGVEVVQILQESRAGDLLREGDIVVGVDGQKVQMARQMVELIQAREIGEQVELEVMRGDERETITVPTVEHTEEPGKAAIGVLVQSHNLQYNLPLEVEIDTRDIVGPSAGLMFAMEILNQLTDEDLTRGLDIAGTGTINLDEEVGPISGVRHKLIAARRDGAHIFLVPRENLGELEGIGGVDGKLDVIDVSIMDEVLQALQSI